MANKRLDLNSMARRIANDEGVTIVSVEREIQEARAILAKIVEYILPGERFTFNGSISIEKSERSGDAIIKLNGKEYTHRPYSLKASVNHDVARAFEFYNYDEVRIEE